MALIFDDIKNEPQTHVFLIGINNYPHLKGGAQEKTQGFAGNYQLEQLTSPAISISVLYEVIMKLHKMKAWVRPLGSIELLMSPTPGTNPLPGIQKQPATIQNIRGCYFNWRQRCETNKDNVALFYYCGHGLEKGRHFLLAEDFGAMPHNPWFEAFDFDSTRNAFHDCKAETQLFFVDACRQITDSMLTTDLNIAPIDNPKVMRSESLYNLTMKATAADEMAYGKRNESSFFCQALIKALEGQVAKKRFADWVVETTAICQHIYTLLEIVEPNQSYKQRCQNSFGNVGPLLKFGFAPEAILEVSCDPDHAIAEASITCIQPRTNQKHTRSPHPLPWSLKIPAGIYELVAEFKNNKFPKQKVFTSVEPPISWEKIKCI
jgi:hypothetical protein